MIWYVHKKAVETRNVQKKTPQHHELIYRNDKRFIPTTSRHNYESILSFVSWRKYTLKTKKNEEVKKDNNVSATSDLLKWQKVDRLGCYTNDNTSYNILTKVSHKISKAPQATETL